MNLMNSKILTQEENESTINIDHFTCTFSVYTTGLKVARMLKERFPMYYKESKDRANACVENVPVSLLPKLLLSKFR